jgi:TPR repeat protein
MSADEGDARDQYLYGLMLQQGNGILMNKPLAAYYYKLSADQGDARAQFKYGLLLSRGDGTLMNKSLAAQYFKHAADQGNKEAQRRWGFSQAEANMDEIYRPLSNTSFFAIMGEVPDETQEDDAVAELDQRFGFPGEHGLSQLKIAGDAGLMIAELCYHLRYDELTNDL